MTGHRDTTKQRFHRIKTMAEHGVSIAAIAAVEEITDTRVYQILRGIGVREGVKRGRQSAFTMDTLSKAVKMVNGGMTLAAVAKELDKPYGSLRYALVTKNMLPRKAKTVWSDELMLNIHKLMTVDRRTAKEVAQQLDISKVNTMLTMLAKWRRRVGVKAGVDKSSLDYDKIYAMHKSGVPIKRIAKEIGRSYSGVYMALLRMAASGRDVTVLQGHK